MSALYCRPYREADYETLIQWWDAHEQMPVHESLLPAMGFIVPEVCAGFLYQTDSDLALIESLIACPKTNAQLRDEALDLVVTHLCEEAKRLGYRSVVGFTQVERVVKRARRNGFIVSDTPYQLVTRRL